MDFSLYVIINPSVFRIEGRYAFFFVPFFYEQTRRKWGRS